MPNEPPTLPVRMRTFSAGAPSTSRSMFLRPNTPWLHECSVQRSSDLVEFADRRARLDRIDDQALIDRRQLGDMGSACESGRKPSRCRPSANRAQRCSAPRPTPAARPGLTASRASTTAGSGSMSIATASAASFACANVSRDHADNRVTDKSHLVGRQRGPRRVFDRRAVAALERQRAFETAIGLQIRAAYRCRARPASRAPRQCRSI